MPSRTIYVSDDDQALFKEAADLAGGFSAAVATALRAYVDRHAQATAGLEEITLDLQESGVRRRIVFTGRRLAKIQRPDPGGTRIDTVYLTAKNQLAVATKVLRSWSGGDTGHEDQWDIPATWAPDFWAPQERTMTVYASIDQLREADPITAQRAETALQTPPFEVLDI